MAKVVQPRGQIGNAGQFRARNRPLPLDRGPHLIQQVTDQRRCGEVWGTRCQAWVGPPDWRHHHHPGNPRGLRRHPDPGQLLRLVEARELDDEQIKQLVCNPRLNLEHVLTMAERGQAKITLKALGETWGWIHPNHLAHHPDHWGPEEWAQVLRRWPTYVEDRRTEAYLLNRADAWREVLLAMWRSDRWQPVVPVLLQRRIPDEVQDIALRRTLRCSPHIHQLLPGRIIWNTQRVQVWAEQVSPEAAVPALTNESVPVDGAALDVLITRCCTSPRPAGALAGLLAKHNDRLRLHKLWKQTSAWASADMNDQWLAALQKLCRSSEAPAQAMTRCTVLTLRRPRSARQDFASWDAFLVPWHRENVTKSACPPALLEAVYSDARAYHGLDARDRSSIVQLPWCPPSVLAIEGQVPVPVWRQGQDPAYERANPWHQALANPRCPLETLVAAAQSPHLRHWSATRQLLEQHPNLPEEYRTLIPVAQ